MDKSTPKPPQKLSKEKWKAGSKGFLSDEAAGNGRVKKPLSAGRGRDFWKRPETPAKAFKKKNGKQSWKASLLMERRRAWGKRGVVFHPFEEEVFLQGVSATNRKTALIVAVSAVLFERAFRLRSGKDGNAFGRQSCRFPAVPFLNIHTKHNRRKKLPQVRRSLKRCFRTTRKGTVHESPPPSLA